jgi:hypothetical protein
MYDALKASLIHDRLVAVEDEVALGFVYFRLLGGTKDVESHMTL